MCAGADLGSWSLVAEPASVGPLRHHAADVATAAGADADVRHAVMLAVSELATNAVLHAYPDASAPGPIRLRCARAPDGRLEVEVSDDGIGLAPRADSPGVGHGLATVGRLADRVELVAGPEGRGTTVRLAFELREPAALAASVFAPLCAQALEALADVSTVDVIRDGVLRRAAALVADDPDLTAWLRGATPPTKPGTATWAALREGGVRLVVHDPARPRSPGGPGEQLSLEWWVSVPLRHGDEAALWGLGGRTGGRPVPSADVLAALAATRPPPSG